MLESQDSHRFAELVTALRADDPRYAAGADRVARQELRTAWRTIVGAGWCMFALLLLALADWIGLLVGLPLAMAGVHLGEAVRGRTLLSRRLRKAATSSTR